MRVAKYASLNKNDNSNAISLHAMGTPRKVRKALPKGQARWYAGASFLPCVP